MKLDNFLSNCRSPRKIINRNGDTLTVPCGKCVDCYERKSMRNATICEKLRKAHKYSGFGTLTYTEDYVPRIALIQFDDGVSCMECTARPLKTKGKYGDYKKYYSNYGQRLYFIAGLQIEEDEIFQEFYKKANTFKDGTTTYLSNGQHPYVLRYCRNSDFQDFIKRLRFYLNREFGSDVAYFGCSEYGPQTFRPHFHFELYFDDSRLLECLGEYINKAWQFGRTDYSLTRSSAASTDYVAGYLNSFSYLPYYFNHKSVAPRSFHSQTFNLPDFEIYRDHLYSYPSSILDTFELYSIGTVHTWCPTSYNLRCLFPKCYGYGTKTDRQRMFLYTLYDRISKKTGFSSCSDIARYILQHEPYICEQLDIHNACYCRPYDFNRDLFREMYIPGSDDDLSIMIYNRVYSAVNVSRIFCTKICGSRFSPEYCYDVIKKLYERLPLFMLRNMYEHMNDFIERVGSDVSIFYYDFPVTCNRDIGFFLKNHPYMSSVFSIRDSRIVGKIKKKEQNDKNGIFVDPIINQINN